MCALCVWEDRGPTPLRCEPVMVRSGRDRGADLIKLEEQRLAREVAIEFVDHEPAHAAAFRSEAAGDVRSEQNIGQQPQR
jgi:hypothetical protein